MSPPRHPSNLSVTCSHIRGIRYEGGSQGICEKMNTSLIQTGLRGQHSRRCPWFTSSTGHWSWVGEDQAQEKSWGSKRACVCMHVCVCVCAPSSILILSLPLPFVCLLAAFQLIRIPKRIGQSASTKNSLQKAICILLMDLRRQKSLQESSSQCRRWGWRLLCLSGGQGSREQGWGAQKQKWNTLCS